MVCFNKAKAQAGKSLTCMMQMSEWVPVKIFTSLNTLNLFNPSTCLTP